MAIEDWGIEDPELQYWFNTKTGQVEQGKQSAAPYRMGPFATAEQAAGAIDLAKQRAAEWAAEEEAED